MANVGRAVRREHLLDLAARVGIKPLAARCVLQEVTAVTRDVASYLEEFGCVGPVSAAAGVAVQAATAVLG